MWNKLARVDRSRLGIAGIGLAVVLFLAVNVLSGALLTSARLDLTADRLYTVSEGTRQVLSAIDEPIDLRFYYSGALNDIGPYFGSHATRVDELLREYRRLSNGQLRIERLDPQPFSPEEDLAVAEGLEGLPLSRDGALAYFGLSGRNSTDDLEVIGYLAPERASFLEYDLTRMVHELANPAKPVVAVLGDLPLMGSQFNRFQPWAVLEAMFQFFDVRFLGGRHERIDDDVTVLLLAQPESLDDASLYAIDQFVMRGGRVLAFLDPLAESMQNPQDPMAAAGGNAIPTLEPLLAAWGVALSADQVVGDQRAAQRVSAMVGGRQAVLDYLPWLALGQAHFASDDIVTGGLQRLHLNSAGAIEAREDATTSIEPLVMSSPDAMAIDVAAVSVMPDPARLIADFVPAGEPFVLAARVTGPVGSAFPDGPPEGVETGAEHRTEASAPLNLILVADADLLADATWLRQQDLLGQQIVIPIANNGDFAINALDNLAGSEGLINLRGRGLTNRPFEVVRAMEQDAEFRFRAKEQELLARIDETQSKIRQLQEEEQQTGVILTAAQQEEIESFRAQMIGLRQELRGVQRSLREDVERLATWVKVINIWAVPVLLALLALMVAWWRRARATSAARHAG
jgi:ABC-type uncharacterized transport system involved in gliding motility auxiliary subunit